MICSIFFLSEKEDEMKPVFTLTKRYVLCLGYKIGSCINNQTRKSVQGSELASMTTGLTKEEGN